MSRQKLKVVSILLVCFSIILTDDIKAAKATPYPIKFRQGNGSELTIKMTGNEHFNYTMTSDDRLIEFNNKDNSYYYVTLNEKGDLSRSDILSNNEEKRNSSEKQFLETIDQAKILEKLKQKLSSVEAIQMRSTKNSLRSRTKFPATGEPRTLVILVEFEDVAFKTATPRQAFHNLLNAPGYSQNEATGSAKDYFIENSNGLFKPQFDVFGPVKVSQKLAYYGAPDGMKNDSNPQQMVYEACSLLSNEIDFSEYDIDNDGKVDNVYIYFAGFGQADSALPNTIWPHSSNINDLNLVLNNTQISSYACSAELNYEINKMVGIGTFTHEFTHVLGFPDLYETNNAGKAFTPGGWSLMDKGNYNNKQNTPPYMSVYERYFLGWLEPIELKSATNVSLPTIDKNVGYIIKTQNNDEYFLFENRQKKGWDTYIPGHGMLVWHIDYDATIWSNNAINNNAAHQRVDIIEADGVGGSSSQDGDSFPGAMNITSLTDQTVPSMRDWQGRDLNKPITNIIEKEGIVYFQCMGGKNIEGKVNILAATNITQSGFTANWDAFPNVLNYTLSVFVLNDDMSLTPVIEYEDIDVGNVTSFQAENLEPGLNYQYIVVATDVFSTTEPSDYISVQTSAPTFEYSRPVVNAAKDITASSFEANWESLNEASSYILNVYKKIYSAPSKELAVDFSGKFDDWSTNCTSKYTSAGYFGTTSPALRLDTDKHYLESPASESPVSNLSFWYRGRNSAESNALIIQGFDGKKWRQIHKIQPLVNQEGGEKVSLDFTEGRSYSAISIIFDKNSTGSLALDDIAIAYGVTMNVEKIAEYDNLEVNSGLSYNITDLDKDETYYYTITGQKGAILSRPSNEVKVVTSKTSGIVGSEINSKSSVYVGDEIYVYSNDSSESTLHIYDMTGRLLYTSVFCIETRVTKTLFEDGVYLVKVGQDVHKIKVD